MKLNQSKLLSLKSPELQDPYPEIPAKKSAVLIPVFEKDGREGVVLTKRNSNLRNHPGQISFPGGVFDEEDGDLQETALREWEEEVGASRNEVDILGQYRATHTFTGYVIYPFVARYSGDFQFHFNQREVEKLIFFNFDDFLEKPFYTIEHPRNPGKPGVYYLDLGYDVLWGATCHILVTMLRELADFERQPKMVKANLSKPPFLDVKIL